MDYDNIRLKCLEIASRHCSDNADDPIANFSGNRSRRQVSAGEVTAYAEKLFEFFVPAMPKKTKRK